MQLRTFSGFENHCVLHATSNGLACNCTPFLDLNIIAFCMQQATASHATAHISWI
jgi:hypothetical protein